MDTNEILFNRYKITRILGKGGAATVYLADDLEKKIPVAIKELETHYAFSEKSKLRFILEARIMQSLNHPNVIQVYDLYEPGKNSNDNFYLIMEYLDGGSLESLFKRHSFLPLERCIKLVTDVAKGLQRAHESGIIHRDVKPSNILLEANGDVAKIGDFGIAHIPSLSLTTMGQPGTLLWLSPEQVMNKEVDERSDQYSLGVVLYQLLTGGEYYLDLERCLKKTKGNDPSKAIYQSILHDSVRKPSSLRGEIPHELDNILGKCLAKKPKDRYQQISEMVAALEAVSLPKPEDIPTSPVIEKQKTLAHAALFSRFISGIIDLGVLSILSMIFSLIISFSLDKFLNSNYNPYFIVLGPVLAFFYFPIFWAWRGQTVGMMAVRMKIADVKGYKPSGKAVFIRSLIYLIFILSLGVPFLFIPLDKERQGLYDNISGIQTIKL